MTLVFHMAVGVGAYNHCYKFKILAPRSGSSGVHFVRKRARFSWSQCTWLRAPAVYSAWLNSSVAEQCRRCKFLPRKRYIIQDTVSDIMKVHYYFLVHKLLMITISRLERFHNSLLSGLVQVWISLDCLFRKIWSGPGLALVLPSYDVI